jgi:hypothetical protein
MRRFIRDVPWFVLIAAIAFSARAQDPLVAPAQSRNGGSPLTSLADFRAAMRATWGGATSIPYGPAVAEATIEDEERSCADLYYERTVLMQRTNSFAPAYYDDPRNQALFYLGTVYTPMYYLLGYTAFESYYDTRRVEAVNRRLDALRQVSARKDCFVRY